MQGLSGFIIIYLLIIALFAVVMTVIDKISAKKGAWRIPEATLMLIGLAGGALPMLLTMKAIRHKTLHKKFMIGLPLEIALHIALIIVILILKFK